MLILLNEPTDRHIAVNTELVAYVTYNVHDAKKRPVSKIVFNVQNADGSPREELVLGTVKEIMEQINKAGKI